MRIRYPSPFTILIAFAVALSYIPGGFEGPAAQRGVVEENVITAVMKQLQAPEPQQTACAETSASEACPGGR